jgi:superfamily II DNA or RNA helicase
MLKLRPYQNDLIDAIRTKFKQGKKRVILCAPTGAGKTVIFSSIVIQTLGKLFNNRALIVTDRIELLSQTWKSLEKIGAEPVIYDAKTKTHKDLYNERVVVAMVETLKRRHKSQKLKLGQFDIIIIDEAHKGNFTAIFDIYPDAFYIGATATPIASKKDNPLKKFWHDIVVVVDTPDLIELDYLVPCRSYGMVAIDMNNLKMDYKTGDYSDTSLFQEYDKQQVYEGLLKAISLKVHDKKTIIFCVNIQHTINTYHSLVQAGYIAVYVTSKSTKEDRAEALADFHSGRAQFMVNCGILTTGYDHPAIECVIMNRATKSLPLFLQCCGRGSRLHDGKLNFTLIDMGENVREHGLWHNSRDWVEWFFNPPKKGAQKAPPVKECPSCMALIHARIMECPYCGHIFEAKEKPRIEGKLVEFDGVPKNLIGRRIDSLNPLELATLTKSKRYSVGLSYRVARSKGYEYLKEFGRWMGYASGWAYHQMKEDKKYYNIIIK